MKYMIRPLTERMITKLRECRQMELEDKSGQLCPPEHFNSSLSGLYARGFIGLKEYSSQGKDLIGVYLTQTGIKLLDSLEEAQQA